MANGSNGMLDLCGQHHQFHHYNPGKASLVKKDILKFLNVFMKNWIMRLKVSKYLAYDEYSIADIATFSMDSKT